MAKQIEERVYSEYKSKVDIKALGYEDLEPHRKLYLGAHLDHSLSDEDVKGLQNESKVLMFLGFTYWSDVAGRHGRESCSVVIRERRQQSTNARLQCS